MLTLFPHCYPNWTHITKLVAHQSIVMLLKLPLSLFPIPRLAAFMCTDVRVTMREPRIMTNWLKFGG